MRRIRPLKKLPDTITVDMNSIEDWSNLFAKETEETVTRIDADVAHVSSDLDSYVDSTNTSITNLDGRLDTVEQDIVTLDGRADTNDGKHSTLDSTIYITGGVTRIGTSSDNTTIEADGTVKFNGAATSFLDELGDITRLKVKGVRITVDDAEIRTSFSSTCDKDDDYLYCNVQINHDWKNGSALKPHIHWEQSGADIPNWFLQYRWQVQGQAKTTAWTTLAHGTSAFTYSSGTLNQITGFGSITPPTPYGEVSDILQVRIGRDCSNELGLYAGSDAALGTQYMVSFDIHKEIDTVGSRSEYSKD